MLRMILTTAVGVYCCGSAQVKTEDLFNHY